MANQENSWQLAMEKRLKTLETQLEILLNRMPMRAEEFTSEDVTQDLAENSARELLKDRESLRNSWQNGYDVTDKLREVESSRHLVAGITSQFLFQDFGRRLSVLHMKNTKWSTLFQEKANHQGTLFTLDEEERDDLLRTASYFTTSLNKPLKKSMAGSGQKEQVDAREKYQCALLKSCEGFINPRYPLETCATKKDFHRVLLAIAKRVHAAIYGNVRAIRLLMSDSSKRSGFMVADDTLLNSYLQTPDDIMKEMKTILGTRYYRRKKELKSALETANMEIPKSLESHVSPWEKKGPLGSGEAAEKKRKRTEGGSSSQTGALGRGNTAEKKQKGQIGGSSSLSQAISQTAELEASEVGNEIDDLHDMV